MISWGKKLPKFQSNHDYSFFHVGMVGDREMVTSPINDDAMYAHVLELPDDVPVVCVFSPDEQDQAFFQRTRYQLGVGQDLLSVPRYSLVNRGKTE
jgi:hypothetical protein